ncbi:MAG TPA: glycosyltransferase family 4 protein [Thermoplasmata archaeon]|nr:glycosyltransferase family 4 protein [Thermoplasmata archaeon]
MKVCLLAPEFLPNRGGVGTYSVDLSRELGRRVDLTVVTLTREDSSKRYTTAEMEEAVGGAARVVSISVARDTFVYNLGFQAAVLRRLPAMLRGEGFDVIHSQHAHMPDLLLRFAVDRPPSVRTIHTTISGQHEAIQLAQRFGGRLESSERWQVALQPGLRAAERLLFARRDLAITVSHWMRDQLVQDGFPDERIRVIHNGVDSVRFTPHPSTGPGSPESDGPTVFFPGRPTLVKGAEVFARAAPLILRRVPNARFVFAGGSIPELERLLSGIHLEPGHIRLLGFVPYERLAEVYAAMDVVVAPTFYENLPFRVLEAMACAVPVVASRICGIPELIDSGANGWLVRPGDSEALAAAVSELLANPGLRARLGAAARSTVTDRFTWGAAAGATVAAYEAGMEHAAS